ncbi:ATP-grasp domain-containing protein (plasmid) [Rhizobium sp. WL3]|uniref:ATP-binding protein n=1 Tax=Rhizobium sp. WL3 TaxID=2603277 RepID=UPI0011C1F6B0|nr:biotin carboxylase N-terminal domain-containing protein [Rhizobium sp. WL3]QEE43178.1 ATP-grasp domain-containing protein [Rhizobium sp. WL3]
MIESLLVANRGEIARRIIRTARRLGIHTIAVHSNVDADMAFVREADEAMEIGAAPARDSYLRQDRILDAASKSGAGAIHPGYGFLSENAEFADAVQAAGLVWVGAPPAAIRAMGLKDAAKQRMIAAGVPVTPGYHGDDQSPERLQSEADAIGYPVLIKAIAGGGGKGMRRVERGEDFPAALAGCRREAMSSFGDDRVLIEKYILSPRHIEVQVFGDSQGDVVHLFERDCSLQRRHQKVIEEAPAPGMDAATRDAVCQAAVKAARAVNYVGAGTIEFIADASEGLRADRIWFMEMNTRLQVEHPVTEAITGQDLVEWQLRIASGEPLPLRQDQLSITGWAMEARLYAENPANGFLPSTGRLEHLRLPDTLRIDSGVEEGDEVTPHYDPMLAKLVSHGTTRRDAVRALCNAAGSVEVWPVRSNAGFLVRTLRHPDFLAGGVDTGFIERHQHDLIGPREPGEQVLQAAAAALLPKRSRDVWTTLTGFRLNAENDRQVAVDVGKKRYLVQMNGVPPTVRSKAGVIFLDGEAWEIEAPRAAPTGHGPDSGPGSGAGSGDGAIVAPMPGLVIAVSIANGDRVKRGQPLLVIEAMKMEQVLHAPFDGVVVELKACEGNQVVEGSLLARIKGEE